MTIVECDDSHKTAWNDFVARHPTASFYHRFEWLDINRTCFGHRAAYLAAIEGDRLAGVFPIVQVKSRLFGNIACSMPFVNYGGPSAESDAVEIALLDEGERVAGRWGADYLEVRSQKNLGERFVTSEHKVSLTVDLDRDPEKLWAAFKTGHRQDIRRGQKNGFVARMGRADLLNDFYAVLSESWRDLGTPIYSKDYLRRVVSAFPDATRICVVYKGDEPAAASFVGVQGDTVEGMWLGTRAKFRTDLAGYVLYWAIIKDCCEANYAKLHLGRSTSQSGSETFKKKWNARSRQLYWHYILRTSDRMPGLNVDNPRYRLAIETWRRLPLGVTQMVGPLIARSIP